MPNNYTYNINPQDFKTLIYGVDSNNSPAGIQIDDNGNQLVSGTVSVNAQNLDIRDLSASTDSITVFNTVTVTADNLDIRALSAATDSINVFNTVSVTAESLSIRALSAAIDSIIVFNTVSVTADNLDIRALSATTDSVVLGGRIFAEDTFTVPNTAATATIGVKNTSQYSMYSYYIRSLSGAGVTFAANLQLSPVDLDAYYADDVISPKIIGSDNPVVIFTEAFTKYTRVSLSAISGPFSAEIYFNAQI